MKISAILSVLSISTVCGLSQVAQVDSSFNPGTGPNPAGEVNDIEVLPDGKLLVGGAFNTWNGEANRGLVRLNGDGSLDSAFNSGVNGAVNRIFFQDSVLWVQANDRLLRLLDNGSLDTNVPPFQIAGMALASGNNIYRVWVPPRPRPIVELYNANGVFQETLLMGAVGDHAYVMEPLPGGGMLLGGGLSRETQNLEAFTPSGFNSNFVANAPRGVRQMALGADSIYVAADNAGSPTLTLARLNGSGRLDTNFNAQPAAVSAMEVAPDGRLVYGNRDVIRLNLDGSVDTSFNPDFDATARINALAAQPDGRILVGGAFNRVDGAPRINIARLLSVAAPLPPGGTNPPSDGGGTPPGDDGTTPGDDGSQPPATGFTVSGFVTDGSTGIPGARVRLRRQVTLTDENGAYQFTDLRAGRYTLRATARGFRIRPVFKRVRVDGDLADVDFLARERARRR